MDMGLNILWRNPDSDPDHFIEDIDYTHMCEVNNICYFSTIDHFACSSLIFKAIKEAGVVHSGENISNHSAIYTKIAVEDLNLYTEKLPSQIRINWNKASEAAKTSFKETVKKNLDEITLPKCLSCANLHCKVHDPEIEEYTLDVLEAIETAGKHCLPKTCSGKNIKGNSIPGWTEFVKPYADESKFWHSLWLSQGKPLGGYVYECMKRSKHGYKYAIRRLKKCNDKIQNEKFISGLIGQGKNIFEEIRKIRGSRNTFSSRIDQVVGSDEIAQHFAGTYSKLYNRVKNGHELLSLAKTIDDNVNETSLSDLDRVNEELIRKALHKLKPNKRDSLFDLVSDCFINAQMN